MKHEALVSVVVPVYQVAEYLHRCVDSILRQTYAELQVILVNDGSTDGSAAICDAFRLKDARVDVVHQANAGLSAARNRGIDLARGEWVTFVDSDDWIHPDMISRLLAVVDENTDIVVGRFERVEQEVRDSPVPSAGAPKRVTSREALVSFLGAQHTMLTISCAKLYRSHLLSGVRFPEDRLHEDEFTTYRLLGAARQVALVDEPLYYYFFNPHSITGSGLTIRHRRDIAEAFEEQVAYLGKVDSSLAAQGRAHLLRKQAQLHQALVQAGEQTEADAVRTSMRENLRAIPHTKQYIRPLAFGHAFARAPRLAGWLNGLRRLPRWAHQKSA